MKAILFKTLQASILLAILYFIFNDINLEELKFIVYNYSHIGIIYIIIAILISDIIYSYRWTYLSKNTCSIMASFEASSISGILNFILPAKLGEISRVIYLKKMYNFKINNSISLIMVEKFFDLILLAISSIIATTLILENDYMNTIGYIFIAFSIASIVIIKTKIMLKITKIIPIKFIRIYANKILSNIYKNFTYMNLLHMLMITSAIWVAYFATQYILFNYIADFKLSIYQVFVVFIVSIIAFSLPLTPGGIGIYEASIIMSLGWYGVDKENALMAGIFSRLIDMSMTTLIAWIILYKKNIKITNLKALFTLKP